MYHRKNKRLPQKPYLWVLEKVKGYNLETLCKSAFSEIMNTAVLRLSFDTRIACASRQKIRVCSVLSPSGLTNDLSRE